jgi:hypothetical protein
MCLLGSAPERLEASERDGSGERWGSLMNPATLGLAREVARDRIHHLVKSLPGSTRDVDSVGDHGTKDARAGIGIRSLVPHHHNRHRR